MHSLGRRLVAPTTFCLLALAFQPGSALAEDAGHVAWERLAFDAPSGLVNVDSLNAVIWAGGATDARVPWVGDRFVAIGRERNALGGGSIWLSRDGRRWTQVQRDALPVDATRFDAVATFGGALVVFGTDSTGQLMAWRAAQRGEWQAAELATLFPQAAFVQGAVAGDGKILAYGAAGDRRFTMWSSADGVTWQAAPLGFTQAVQERPGGDGFVALISGSATRRQVRVFMSRDGVTWKRGRSLGPSRDPGTEALGRLRQRLWAATHVPGSTTSTRLWTSTDGRRWKRANAPRGQVLVDQFTTVDGHLVGIGATKNGPAAWTLSDHRWRVDGLERPPGGRLSLAASNGRVVVAFGTAPELRNYYRYGPDLPDTRDARHGNPDRVPIPDVVLPGTPQIEFDASAWRDMWAHTPGSRLPRCVATAGRTEVRSGQFVAGNFSSFVNDWNGTAEHSKLYFIPLNPQVKRWGDPAPQLNITADLLDGSAPRRVALTFDNYSVGNTGALFYATGTVLPESGTWRLTIGAGLNHGCFKVTV